MVADEFVPLVVSRERTGIDGKEEWANAHFLFALKCAGLFRRQRIGRCSNRHSTGAPRKVMAVQLDAIRKTAERVAASHQLEVVDLEYQGGVKFRTLRVFIEKDASARAALAELAASGEAEASVSEALPQGVPVEMLSGVTHEDCEQFARDFGTVLDVEDLIPGAEYTLEVSSPGLERKLSKAADFQRFQGSLVKVQTFTAVNNNRHWQGRLTKFEGGELTIDLSAVKQKGKARKAVSEQTVTIALANVEKANLVAEI
jgi:ribosome maturation factor RimP